MSLRSPRHMAGTALIALSATATLTLTAASSASATSRTNYCGSSYTFVKSWPLQGLDWTREPGKTVGYIDIYYSRATGRNCAIARPDNSVPNPRRISVKIRRSGHAWRQYDGWGNGSNYTHYAGPVYQSAPGACIDFAGGFSYNQGNGYQPWSEYTRKHCG
ncbi:hypothetical protein ACFWXK_10670 [Streptomyces sp. NPDC059070]|uniref:hypothetical protein n=1 Tax=Streptomyces sp. NPDC059070 TaxID=3346713 RepID=UPI0036CD173F